MSDSQVIESDIDMSKSYEQLHKPSSSFSSRADYLNHELQIMKPKRWGVNLPFKDYRFEFEDAIPALAGTIGKIVMVGAVSGGVCCAVRLARQFCVRKCAV